LHALVLDWVEFLTKLLLGDAYKALASAAHSEQENEENLSSTVPEWLDLKREPGLECDILMLIENHGLGRSNMLVERKK
jgi:hypothetical protein